MTRLRLVARLAAAAVFVALVIVVAIGYRGHDAPAPPDTPTPAPVVPMVPPLEEDDSSPATVEAGGYPGPGDAYPAPDSEATTAYPAPEDVTGATVGATEAAPSAVP